MKRSTADTTAELPDIVFSDILPKLPAKSISRFKCVSKQWYSFLKTPGFLRLHHLHVIKVDDQNYQKLFFLPVSRPWVFRTIDCETPKNGLTSERPLPFEVKPSQKVTFVTSLHGMVCLKITGRRNRVKYSDIILWNPVTGDHKTVYKADFNSDNLRDRELIHVDKLIGFFYSFSENDYKLVCLTRHIPNVYILSLKSDSWRKVEPTETVSYDLIMSSVSLNEKFHRLRELFEFEKLSDIAASSSTTSRADLMGFVVLKGYLHFCVAIVNSMGEYDRIELWMMDEVGFWEVAPKEEYDHSSYYRLHVMRDNGNRLMYGSENVYVLETKEIMCSFKPAFRPGGKYMETLVSPNQYMN